MPDLLSGLIWFQTVCKVYQQTTLGSKDLNVGKTAPSSSECTSGHAKVSFHGGSRISRKGVHMLKGVEFTLLILPHFSYTMKMK